MHISVRNKYQVSLKLHDTDSDLQVIYEDSDEEEMTYKDLAVCFW